MQVFPEGTRSRDGAIRQKVHLRLVEARWAEGIPVVPAAVMHTERTTPVGPLPLVVPFQTWSARDLPPIHPEAHPGAEAFTLAAWGAVVGAAEEMAELAGEREI